MPLPYVKKVADKQGKSVESLEGKWKKAKGIAKKEGKGDSYAYVTGIFKRMVGESTKPRFSDFLNS